MSENWDSYLCRIDGQPASVFADLGIASATPITAMPHMAFIRLFMRNPRPDGLSSQEEFDALIEIESALEVALVGPDQRVYVGRTTTSGFRNFVFYVADDSDWQAQVSIALSPFGDYRYEAGSRSDSGWLVYREFLYPSEASMQQILNRSVRSLLSDHGDETSTVREIDHWAHFATQADRAKFLIRVESQGFALRVPLDEAHDDGRYWLQVFGRDRPDRSFDQVTTDLARLAAEMGGVYDGWEAPVVSQNNIDKNAI